MNKIRLRNFAFILLLGVVTACSGTLKDNNRITTNGNYHKMNSYSVNNSDYGVAIIKVYVNNKNYGSGISNAIYSKTTAFQTDWVYEEGKTPKEAKWFRIVDGVVVDNNAASRLAATLTGVSSLLAENQNYQILLLRPGTYSMRHYKMYNINRFGIESIAKPKNLNKSHASFNIKAGEVLYLGDVSLTMENMGMMSMMGSSTYLKIDVKDNSEEVNSFLSGNSNVYFDKNQIKTKLLNVHY